ncbi:aminotransferase class V-fold PLP-dependent enzyme [candidate division KSB1 bacterium]|nr:aminotransferase class V-fold PLP-dependent enzyme [candidate division KSB1 bacterium]
MNNVRDLFYIRPDIVFLNNGSFGACPKPVFEVYQNWQLELEQQPVEFLGRRHGTLMQKARKLLATFLGTSGENLFFVPNATTGLNIVAHSLKLEPGDEILTTDHEYGAMDRMWQFICQKRGSKYVRQPLRLPIESKEQVIETIWSGVTNRTKVLFISHITSPTALTMPLKELTIRAKDAGIILLVDGAHGPGQVPIDLEEMGIDFYSGNCHKWLLTPKGCAFLYARPEVQSLIEPLIVSWGNKSVEDSPFIQENEFQGTRDIAAYLSVSAAIKFWQKDEWQTILKKCHELTLSARSQLIEVTGLDPICPGNDGWFQQMVAQPLPTMDRELFKQRLYDEFNIEIPVMECRDKSLIRISIQGYNTEQDVEKLMVALAKLLPEMAC